MMGNRLKMIYSPTSAYKLSSFEFILTVTNFHPAYICPL